MDKQKIFKLFMRYHFLIIFGAMFIGFMGVMTVQAICTPKQMGDAAIDKTNVSDTSAAADNAGDQPTQTDGNTGQDGQDNAAAEGTQTENGTQAGNAAQVKPEFEKAELSYLDGALFIGDSRTAMLAEYAGWDNTHFFVETGMHIWNVLESTCAVVNGEKVTVDAALQQGHYDKIYIQLGINELGRGTADSFCEQYQMVLERIQTLQPQAVIYLQSIMHVSQKRDEKGDYINNAEVDARNEKLCTLADNIRIFWLDENEVFDEAGTGRLNEDYTSDGVHLKAKCIPLWQEFLLSHVIKK